MSTEKDKSVKPKLTVKEIKKLEDKAVNKVGKLVCKDGI